MVPEPPSSNRYWRRHGTIIHVSAEAKAYKQAVGMLTSKHRTGNRCIFPSGDLSVAILWHRSSKRGDLDNRLKILLDALGGLVFRNDRQVAEIFAKRVDSHPAIQKGFMRVTVQRVADTSLSGAIAASPDCLRFE